MTTSTSPFEANPLAGSHRPTQPLPASSDHSLEVADLATDTKHGKADHNYTNYLLAWALMRPSWATNAPSPKLQAVIH
jgi:hypothetical protein